MADAGERLDGATLANDAPNATENFLEQSYLTYVVPSRTNIHLDSAFKHVGGGKPIAESIEQRESLFFDETVQVLLILKMPWSEEAKLQAQINRLVMELEAQVVNNSPADRSSQPLSETIFKGRVQDVTHPFVVVDHQGIDSEAGSPQTVYAMWKLPVFINRPRIRPQHPTVVFTASASVKPATSGETSTHGTGYLPSGTPSSFNLLESFSSDPALHGIKPRLSALRVSRVAPVSRQQDQVAHLRAQPHLRLPVHAVIHTRIRFSRPNTAQATSALIAVLEVDFTPHVECEVLLDAIELVTHDGTVQSLNDQPQMQLPLSCVAHDHITFLYHINPHQPDKTPRNFLGSLDISITATAQVIPDVCTPKLSLGWNAALDFTIPVNPSFNNMAESSGIQRAHKPSQLSITSNAAITPLKSPSVTRPDALPGLEASARAEAAVPDLGITVSFTGPSERVHPGDVFSWTVHVVNRSSEAAIRPPRKLALVAVPRRRRNDTTTRPARPPSTASRRRGEKEIADAVVDANILHALQMNSAVDAADVICLSADTRVGPLAPGACHVVELQFLALREGIVGVEAVRVVDLASQEHVDIRDLPTTIVEPAVA